MAASLTFQCNIGELVLRLLFCSFGMLDFCHTAGEMFVLLDQSVICLQWSIFECVKSARIDIFRPLHGDQTLEWQ